MLTGSAFDIRSFHETVLSVGPVSLQALEEFTTAWIASQLERSTAMKTTRIDQGLFISVAVATFMYYFKQL
jgi:hypothetical protein